MSTSAKLRKQSIGSVLVIRRHGSRRKAKMKKQLEDIIQDKRQLENEFTVAIAQAVEQTMSHAIKDARFQSSLQLQSSRVDQMQAGPRIKGKTVSFNGPNTLALLNSRQ